MTNARRRRRKGLLLNATLWSALAVILVPGIALARTWRVPDEHATIQAAVNAAVANDTVLVGPGTYLESVDAGDKWLTLLSVAGRDATVIDAYGAGRGVTLPAGGRVEGFTIQNGDAIEGGGIRISGPGASFVDGNRIQDCRAGQGGGIWVNTRVQGLFIRRNEIRGNWSDDDGGGIYSSAPCVIEENSIVENRAYYFGGGVFSYGPVHLLSNVIVGNCTGIAGGGVDVPGSSEIDGNTIIGNSADNGGTAIALRSSSGGRISQNIIVSNGFTCWWTSAKAIYCGPTVQNVRIDCNDLWGNKNGDLRSDGAGCDTTGLGNFTLDPMFCDAGAGSYSLQQGSPCAPASGTGCGLVGALPVACGGTQVVPMTWGRLKALYGKGEQE